MPTTVAAVANALKTDYLGVLHDQRNNGAPMWKRVKHVTDRLGGASLTATLALTTQRPQRGIRFVNENAALPATSDPGYVNTTIAARFLYGVVQITGQAIHAGEKSQATFVDILSDLLNQVSVGIRKEYNRNLWGRGNAIMGALTGLTGGGLNPAGTALTATNVDRFEIGMFVDLLDEDTNATFTSSTGLEITNVDIANSTVTFGNNSWTTPAGDTTVNVTRESMFNIAPMGIEGIVDGRDANGNYIVQTLQGINRATNAFWDASVISESGTPGTNAALELTTIESAFNLAERRSGAVPTILASHYGVMRAYLDLVQPDRRFVGDMAYDLGAGAKALKYQAGAKEVPWFVDHHVPRNVLFGICEPTLGIYETRDLHWIDETGSVLYRISGRDTFEAVLRHYYNLGTTQPNASFVVRDITEA